MKTDCFWCGTVYSIANTACPQCATPTGQISVQVSEKEQE